MQGRPLALPVCAKAGQWGRPDQVGVANVPASATCPARKLPTIVLIDAPKADFVGDDAMQIDIEGANRMTTFAFHVIVQDPNVGEKL